MRFTLKNPTKAPRQQAAQQAEQARIQAEQAEQARIKAEQDAVAAQQQQQQQQAQAAEQARL